MTAPLTAPTLRPRIKWRTAALMCVVGALFVALLVIDPGNRASWAAAAVINLIAATDSLRRQYGPAGATA